MSQRLIALALTILIPLTLMGCGSQEVDLDKPDQFKAKLEEAGKAAQVGKEALKAEKNARK